MEALIKLIEEQGWFIALLFMIGTITISLWRYTAATLRSQKDDARDWLLSLLAQAKYETLYKESLLRPALNRLAALIGDKQQFTDRADKPTGWVAALARPFDLHLNPWTEASFRFVLILAFLYPIFAVVLFWSMGGSGEISGLEILTGDMSMMPRLFLPMLFALLVFYACREPRKRKNLGLYLALTAAMIVTPLFVGAINITIVFVIALGISISVSYGAIFSKANIVAVPLCNFALVFAIVFILLSAVVGTGSSFVVVVAAVSVAALSYDLINKLYESLARRCCLHLYWALCIPIYITLTLVIVYALPTGEAKSIPDESKIILIFFSLLPLINAPLDWLSLGVTRGLLYAIVHDKHQGLRALMWAGLDIVLALIFLCLVALVSVSAVAALNYVSHLGGGEVIFDLQLLFSALRTDGASLDHGWLYFMLLSTLLPTVIHLIIASVAFVMILPRSLVQGWADAVKQRDQIGRKHSGIEHGVCFYCSVVPVLGIIAPLMVISALVWFVMSGSYGHVGDIVLDLTEPLARGIDPFMQQGQVNP